ncbi:hypothetical protein MPSI1_001894 [Malassezia psittaci]|uniref:MINDY deubiquitinase domain-containing protein n=1 Tax=Malassezia psittaci TaxID=1821823 RepID=A0AAF0F9A9_9BASI|nr:hypothetical protein MPSI1_001894 [Malassezia psittaci]
MSHNPFLAHTAPKDTQAPTQAEHASALDDLVGLDLNSPSLPGVSQPAWSNSSTSAERGSEASAMHGPFPTSYANPTKNQSTASMKGMNSSPLVNDSGLNISHGMPLAYTSSAMPNQETQPVSNMTTSFTSPEFQALTTNEPASTTNSATTYETTSYRTPPSYNPATFETTSDYSTAPQAYNHTSAPFHQQSSTQYTVPASHTRTANNPFLAAEEAASPLPESAPSANASLNYLVPVVGGEQVNVPRTEPPVNVPAHMSSSNPTPNAASSQSQAQIEADEAIARTLAQESSADETQWPLKEITWNGRAVKIIMQNDNGPCSLLALCNVLLLEQRLEITPADRPAVSYSYLSRKLTELLITQNANPVELSSALRALPSLQQGLDVNIGFASPIDFAPDTAPDALMLFRLARVALVHGWLPDPNDAPTTTALQQHRYYNQAAAASSHTDGSFSSNQPESGLLREYFDQHRTQLTPYGVAQLKQRMRPNSLAVLFRNMHLSVLYRPALSVTEPELCTLVTDAGFLLEDGLVWESFEDPLGNDHKYFDSHLVRAPFAPQRMHAAPPSPDENSDYALAVELQNQERNRALAARRRHRERESGRTRNNLSGVSTDAPSPDSSSTRENPIQKVWSKIKRKN